MSANYTARTLCVLILVPIIVAPVSSAGPIRLQPRGVLSEDATAQWAFDGGAPGWRAAHDCRLAGQDGLLVIESTGNDPYLYFPPLGFKSAGPMLLRISMRSDAQRRGQVFWVTDESPNWDEENSQTFKMNNDGQWHEYTAAIEADSNLRHIRLDPGTKPGRIEVRSVGLYRRVMHPLELEEVKVAPGFINVFVRNHSQEPLDFTIGELSFSAQPGQVSPARLPDAGRRPFESVTISVESEGLPPLSHTVFVCRPDAPADWLTLSDGNLSLEVCRDGSGARIVRDGRLVGLIAPLVACDGKLPSMRVSRSEKATVEFAGEAFETLTIEIHDAEISYQLKSSAPAEGPVVRVAGRLEQGLLAGVEYLGQDEPSSSTADIETEEHVRFEPNPMWVTMGLTAVITEDHSVAVAWDDMSLQPVFATPNFLDGAADHRMGLKGTGIRATIRIDDGFGQGKRMEDLILWAVKRGGLPPLPQPPRTAREQLELCRKGLEPPLRGDDGWDHCYFSDGTPRGTRQFFVDHVSTLWQLTGEMPDVPRLAPGGAHIANWRAAFTSGRADIWLNWINGNANNVIRRQKPDGSFRYQGRFLKGHFEDTASGQCAIYAASLLEHARLTGSQESLAGGVKTLQYMKRFRTPRGAQVWELSLHTPDIMASAWAAIAYTRGYELTDDPEYLDLARRWAVSGIPFVYQWGNRPVMRYATIPVYGATHWKGTNWMGLPVQWCGTRYAQALLILAEHDQTLDWRKIAEGILIAAEQMQYVDGPTIGLLPDAYELADQARRPVDINPCALVSLRRQLDGQPARLMSAADKSHRVVSPWPVSIRAGRAHVTAPPGTEYQVVIDGQRIQTVRSQGQDVIDLQ